MAAAQMFLIAACGGDEPLLESGKILSVTVEGIYCVERDSADDYCAKYPHKEQSLLILA
jgi:hypothetical protein